MTRTVALDAAEAVGIVSKKGSWYYYGEEKLAQGRDKTLIELTEKPDIAECGLLSPLLTKVIFPNL